MPPRVLFRILALLGVNSVPALGWFGGGWSEGSVLAVYWCESILLALLISARIYLHRIQSRTAGHWQVHQPMSDGNGKPIAPPKPGPNRFLLSYLGVMLPFLLAQGVVLAIVLVMLPGQEGMADTALRAGDVVRGVSIVAAFLVFGFLVDLRTIGEQPFAWMRSMADHAKGRLLVFQFSILIGLPLMAVYDQPRLFFSVFIFLKTWLDFSVYLPAYEPKEAPRWLCRIMDRIGPAEQNAESGGFAAYWSRDAAAQKEAAALHERRMD